MVANGGEIQISISSTNYLTLGSISIQIQCVSERHKGSVPTADDVVSRLI